MNESAKWVTASVLVAASVLACGGAAAPTPSASAPAAPSASSSAASSAAATPANPPLAVAPMTLTVPHATPVELEADGSIVIDGKSVAKFTGADLVDAEGKTLLTVAGNGDVTVTGGKHAKFGADDTLEIGGGKIRVGDDGVVTLIAPDGKPDGLSGKPKFVGFQPAARRAATVLFAATTSRTIASK